MKNKLLLFLIIGVLFTLVACSNNPQTSESDDGTEETSIFESIYKPSKKAEGDYLLDTEIEYYTAETLPEEYNRHDFDGDGLINIDEIKYGTDMYNIDTDGDGITDNDEVAVTKTDPTKYSTRDDGISDLEWWFSQEDNFKEDWSPTGPSGFKVYFAKPTDRMFDIKRANTDAFDNLDTISEAYQIKNFSGKMSLNCSSYTDEVYLHIDIYILRDGKVLNANAEPEENGLIDFEVQANDIFVAVYRP